MCSFPRAWAALRGVLVLITFLGAAGWTAAVEASTPAAPVTSRLADLAAHPTWRALLHVPPGEARSEVLSPEFFLATTAPGEPLAELQAALFAWSEPWPADGTPHARCRFPARFFWLARQGLLPGYNPREPRCTSLERWAQFDRLRSVSLLLVSGYLGNPASNFGHALIRLNTDTPDGVRALLDVGISFGALIPENEMVPVYVVKGLSGGYLSGYSDKYFYTHDLVYTRSEARDIWDYELALDDNQRTWLVMHLYEMVGRHFRYYFLHRNCAWRLAQAIELVSGRTMTQHGAAWYTPIELFHRLHAADADGPGPLIAGVRYVPSSERQFRHGFAQLDPADRDLVNRAMREPPPALPALLAPRLAALPGPRRAQVLEALLRHAQLLEVAEEPKVQPATRERMAQLLRLRLAEPPAESDPPPPPERPSPANGNPPATLGLGLVHTPGATRWLLRGAAYDHNGMDEHGLERGELVVLDATLSGNGHGSARLDQLDVIRVRKIDTSTVPIEGFDGWSWQFLAGARRHGHAHPGTLRPQVSLAGGHAWSLGRHAAAWLMLDTGVLTDPGAAMLAPRLGLQAESGAWAVALDSAYRLEWRLNGRPAPEASRRQSLWTHQFSARWRPPGQRVDVRVGLGRDRYTRATLAVSGSW